MFKIYRVFNGNGESYIGSTSQDIKMRMAQHKSKIDRSSVRFLLSGFTFEQLNVEILEVVNTKHRFARENYWIDKFNAINQCRAGNGPIGFKPSAEQLESAAHHMRKRWQTNKEQMKRKVNAHKTFEFQSAAGVLGNLSIYNNKPTMIVCNKSDGKIIGRFKTTVELGKLLNVHDTTAARYLNGKLKIGGILYEFRRV
jgi:group I intron endonuclease